MACGRRADKGKVDFALEASGAGGDAQNEVWEAWVVRCLVLCGACAVTRLIHSSAGGERRERGCSVPG